jgi:hypothetical protein
VKQGMCHCDSYPIGLPSYKYLLKTSTVGFYKNLKPHLRVIEENPRPGLSFYQCTECNRIWVKDWPLLDDYGDSCFYIADVGDPDEWLELSTNRKNFVGIAYRVYLETSQEREEYEDKLFLKRLPPEIGPAKCKAEGCSHLSIKNSVMCKQHHLDMIKKLQGNQGDKI